jgi:hypothetical protein
MYADWGLRIGIILHIASDFVSLSPDIPESIHARST